MVGREMTDRFPKRPNVKIGDVSMEIKTGMFIIRCIQNVRW